MTSGTVLPWLRHGSRRHDHPALVAGGDHSRDRAFDVAGRAKRCDPDAGCATRWPPVLAGPSPPDAREPWRASAAGVELGVDDPAPTIELDGLSG